MRRYRLTCVMRHLTASCAVMATMWGEPAAAQLRLRPRSVGFWVAAASGLAAAAALDQRARSFTLAHPSGVARTFADAGNTLGTGRNIIAGLAVSYIGARLTHHRSAADAVLRISAGYAVSNAMVGLLKPVVGRHRPDSTNDAWRFDPFSSCGAWHSFPSSHAVHAFSLATGLAVETRPSWAGALGYTCATVVAWSRLYDDQHWASDVTASAIIGISTAATTTDWLDRRWPRVTAKPRAR